MYKEYELYNKNNDYFTDNGQIITHEMMLEKYPAIEHTKMLVTLFGRTVLDIKTMDYMRGINRIKGNVSDADAIAIIQSNDYYTETESTTQERIAAALEFIELIMMENKTNEF